MESVEHLSMGSSHKVRITKEEIAFTDCLIEYKTKDCFQQILVSSFQSLLYRLGSDCV